MVAKRPVLLACGFVLAFCADRRSCGQTDEASQSVDVFVSGAEGYHTFRIPALIATPRKTLLAFCEGRKASREDLGDNDLMLKRSEDGGRTWGELQLVYEEGGDAKVAIGNPTAVVDRSTDTIWLAMLRDARDVLITASSDDGRTWSRPRDITSQVKRSGWGFYAVGPGVGVQIEHGRYKGRLVIPAYHRTTADKSGPSNAHVFYSDDHGKSWRLGGDVGLHTNECQVVEVLEGGASQLLINARNHWGRSGKRPELAGVRIVARSQDGGAAWSPPAFDRTLIEPQCQASLVRFRWQAGDEKGCLLFANPASRGRNRMTVRASFDEGGTWPAQKLVYAGSAAYSCLCALPDGRIGLIYERDDYGKLTFTAFRLENLKQD